MVLEKAELNRTVDISVIRPDGPIRDDVDRLSKYLKLEDLAQIELVHLRKQAAALQAQLDVINTAVEMLEIRYPRKQNIKSR